MRTASENIINAKTILTREERSGNGEIVTEALSELEYKVINEPAG